MYRYTIHHLIGIQTPMPTSGRAEGSTFPLPPSFWSSSNAVLINLECFHQAEQNGDWKQWPYHYPAYKKQTFETWRTYLKSDSISPRYPQKLESINFKKKTSYKNRRSRSRWQLLETVLKTQWEDRYKLHCPIRHSSKIFPNFIYEPSNYEKMVFLRCPARFWNFWSEFVTPYLNSTLNDIDCLSFFLARFDRVCIVSNFGSVRSPSKSKTKKEGRRYVCRLVHELRHAKISSPIS